MLFRFFPIILSSNEKDRREDVYVTTVPITSSSEHLLTTNPTSANVDSGYVPSRDHNNPFDNYLLPADTTGTGRPILLATRGRCGLLGHTDLLLLGQALLRVLTQCRE